MSESSIYTVKGTITINGDSHYRSCRFERQDNGDIDFFFPPAVGGPMRVAWCRIYRPAFSEMCQAIEREEACPNIYWELMPATGPNQATVKYQCCRNGLSFVMSWLKGGASDQPHSSGIYITWPQLTPLLKLLHGKGQLTASRGEVPVFGL